MKCGHGQKRVSANSVNWMQRWTTVIITITTRITRIIIKRRRRTRGRKIFTLKTKSNVE